MNKESRKFQIIISFMAALMVFAAVFGVVFERDSYGAAVTDAYDFEECTLENTIRLADGNDYKITATYGSETGIPSDAVLSVKEATRKDRDYEELSETAMDILAEESEDNTESKKGNSGSFELSSPACTILDIKITDGKGREYQPAEGTSVAISIVLLTDDAKATDLKKTKSGGEEPAADIVHIGDDGDVSLIGGSIEATGEGYELSFETESFSYFVVVWDGVLVFNDNLDQYALRKRNSTVFPNDPYASMPALSNYTIDRNWIIRDIFSFLSRDYIEIAPFATALLNENPQGSSKKYADKYELDFASCVSNDYRGTNDSTRAAKEAQLISDANRDANKHLPGNYPEFKYYIIPDTLIGHLNWYGVTADGRDYRLSHKILLNTIYQSVIVFKERDTRLVLTNSSGQAVTMRLTLQQSGYNRDAEYEHMVAMTVDNGTPAAFNLNSDITIQPGSTVTITVPTAHGDSYEISNIAPVSKSSDSNVPVVYNFNNNQGASYYGFARFGIDSADPAVNYTEASAPDYSLSHTYDREITFYDGDDVNGGEAICKIINGEKSYPFMTLSSAVNYAEKKMSDMAEILMLTDYAKPESDVVNIRAGNNVKITTAFESKKDPDGFWFRGAGNSDGNAIISRGENGASMISSSGTLTLENIEFNGDNKQCSGNGGIVNAASGTLNIGEGALLHNSKASKGGAVYMANAAVTLNMNGGTITGNTGGGVYADGASNRINLSGEAFIYDNKDNGKQMNLVVTKAGTGIIRTAGSGLSADAHIGIYHTGNNSTDPYKTHGRVGDDFGTNGAGNNNNFNCFTNDRNGLFGEANGGLIRWQAYVCKITDASGNLLYRKEGDKYVPAVYNRIGWPSASDYTPATASTSAFGEIIVGALYTKNGTPYTDRNLCVKMLRDYAYPDQYSQSIRNTRCTLQFTTAETTLDGDDVFVFTGGAEETRATLTAYPMDGRDSFIHIFNNIDFTVSNLVFEGNRDRSSKSKDHGGVFNVREANGKLTVESGTLMRNAFSKQGGGAICTSGVLVMNGGIIDNCEAANGGGGVMVYSGSFTINGGIIRNCGHTGKVGGAVHVKGGKTMRITGSPQFINNTASNGAGIYLENNSAKLYIQGSPVFTNNKVIKNGYASKKNGSDTPYTDNKVEQDIYLAGTGSPLGSLIVSGAITSGPGSIWVWANDDPHYKERKQFAVFENAQVRNQLTNNGTLESTLRAFRNAQDNSKTGNRSDTWLYGTTGANNLWIYWSKGVVKTRKVALRKVDSNNHPKVGAKFTIYAADRPDEVVVAGDETLDESVCVSKSSGVYWIGSLPCDDYLIRENNGRWYFMIVGDDEIIVSSGDKSNVSARNGYASRDAAKTALDNAK